jgi:hypothetical protein
MLLARVVAKEDAVCVRWSLIFLVDVVIVRSFALVSWQKVDYWFLVEWVVSARVIC